MLRGRIQKKKQKQREKKKKPTRTKKADVNIEKNTHRLTAG